LEPKVTFKELVILMVDADQALLQNKEKTEAFGDTGPFTAGA
jgi:hypothetical protein